MLDYIVTDGNFVPELASSPPPDIQEYAPAATAAAPTASAAGSGRSRPAEGAVGQLPEVDSAPPGAEQPADQGRKKTSSMELLCLLQAFLQLASELDWVTYSLM